MLIAFTWLLLFHSRQYHLQIIIHLFLHPLVNQLITQPSNIIEVSWSVWTISSLSITTLNNDHIQQFDHPPGAHTALVLEQNLCLPAWTSHLAWNQSCCNWLCTKTQQTIPTLDPSTHSTDTSPVRPNSTGVAPMSLFSFSMSLFGPVMRDVPVSAIAAHDDLSQKEPFPETSTLTFKTWIWNRCNNTLALAYQSVTWW